jgi:uncharacterized membrane protein
MSTLFAFPHHLCAFTLVSAVAIEFTLIRQERRMGRAQRNPSPLSVARMVGFASLYPPYILRAIGISEAV